jgi:hypothetical protein
MACIEIEINRLEEPRVKLIVWAETGHVVHTHSYMQLKVETKFNLIRFPAEPTRAHKSWRAVNLVLARGGEVLCQCENMTLST